MKCYVERERSTFGMATTYRCYLEGPGAGNGGSEGNTAARFLMSAKKRVVNKTSYYLISLDADALEDRGSESILGKVREPILIFECVVLLMYIIHIDMR